MLKKLQKVFVYLGAVAFVGLAFPVHAAILTGLDCADPNSLTSVCSLCDIIQLIVNISDLIISYSGVIALVMIIFGGVLMLTAWGKENRVTMGKQTVIAAFVGLFIVFAAWTIINTIIMATVGSQGGGFSTVVDFAGGNDNNWSKCPKGGESKATVNPGTTSGTGSSVDSSGFVKDPSGYN